MSLFKGFRGLARIRRSSGAFLYFRFTNADIGLSQDVNVYLPSYGGSGLYRIISPKVGDITGRISLLLCEGLANDLYTIASNSELVDIELSYRDGSSKYFTGAKLNQLGFSCKAGEIVQVSIDLLARTQTPGTTTLSWLGTNKLITWDKATFQNVLIPAYGYQDVEAQSFTYNIENNIVVNRTASSLLPFDLRDGIQKVSGNVVWFDVTNAQRETLSYKVNSIAITNSTFSIDDFTVTHKISHHWTYRVPLSPELLVTTLEWTRADNLV